MAKLEIKSRLRKSKAKYFQIKFKLNKYFKNVTRKKSPF